MGRSRKLLSAFDRIAEVGQEKYSSLALFLGKVYFSMGLHLLYPHEETFVFTSYNVAAGGEDHDDVIFEEYKFRHHRVKLLYIILQGKSLLPKENECESAWEAVFLAALLVNRTQSSNSCTAIANIVVEFTNAVPVSRFTIQRRLSYYLPPRRMKNW